MSDGVTWGVPPEFTSTTLGTLRASGTYRGTYVPPSVTSPRPAPEEVVRTCPSCGRELEDHRCKLTCPCGYFMSCSDYY